MNGEHFDPEIEDLLMLTEAPGPEPDVEAAWGRFRIRRAQRRVCPVRRLRSEWVAACALLGLIGALGFSPVARSATVHVLSLFRATRIAAVAIMPSARAPLANHAIASQLGQMLKDDTIFTLDEANRPAASAAAASSWAGFSALYAASWQGAAPTFQLRGAKSFQITLDVRRAQKIFDRAGVAAPALPAALNGARISMHQARGLAVMYGDCSAWAAHALHESMPQPPGNAGCTVLGEGPSPTVRLPQGLDMRDIAVVGLQLLGMSAAAASQYTRTIDWSSTLVVPFPAGMATARKVVVSGAQGVLLTATHPRPGYALLWSKNGMIYSIAGSGRGGEALALARKLR
ncbi:MAG: hypothetical protein ACRD0Y_07775 [Terriglobales bacterium]